MPSAPGLTTLLAAAHVHARLSHVSHTAQCCVELPGGLKGLETSQANVHCFIKGFVCIVSSLIVCYRRAPAVCLLCGSQLRHASVCHATTWVRQPSAVHWSGIVHWRQATARVGHSFKGDTHSHCHVSPDGQPHAFRATHGVKQPRLLLLARWVWWGALCILCCLCYCFLIVSYCFVLPGVP